MTLLYENYGYDKARNQAITKTGYWINWRFDKSYYMPGWNGTVNLWMENFETNPIYISKIGAQFDWQSEAWYEKDLGIHLAPRSSQYLSFLNFAVPENIVGSHTCQFGVEIYENHPVLGWSKRDIVWFQPANFEVTVYPRYRCFVSRSNREENKPIVEPFVNRIQDWGFDTYTVGINVFAEEGREEEVIDAEIQKADCLIGIATKRYQAWVNGYAWKTLEWLHDEVSLAYGPKKPILIIKEEDLELGGLPSKLPSISFNPYNIQEGLQKLDNRMLQFRRGVEIRKTQEFWGNVGKLAIGGLLVLTGIGIGRKILAP